MQKHLWLFITLYLLMGCKLEVPTQDGQQSDHPSHTKPQTTETSSLKQKDKTTGNINAQLDAQEEDALKFLLQILKNDKINPNGKTYTDEESNKLITYLKPIKIKTMLANIKEALALKKDIETNLALIPTYRPQRDKLINQLQTAIDEYNKNLKTAAGEDSFDIIANKIQNISINQLKQIAEETKDAVDITKIVDSFSTEMSNAFDFLEETLTNNNAGDATYTFALFNKFILDMGTDTMKEMLKNIMQKIKNACNAEDFIKEIDDPTQKANLEREIKNAKEEYQKSIRQAIGNDTSNSNTVKQKIEGVPSPQKFKTIKDQSQKQILQAQSQKRTPKDGIRDVPNPMG
ncbi:BTA121 domain-containing protein surface lipoprotein [Borrelia persica]|uniref:BTA121 domain-containing protein surface lipoprotein n=1 Tax=Borrelia persica TaxID=44448 RepID=UPI000465781E|nr:hypothetical protein [Borrelia persica]